MKVPRFIISSAIVFILLFLQSCLSVGRIERNCDQFAKICLSEQGTTTTTEIILHDTIIYKDTVIYVEVPGKLIVDSVKIPYVVVQKIKPYSIFLENTYASAKAYIEGKYLHLDLVEKDTTLAFKLDNAIKETRRYKELYEIEKTNTIVIPEVVKKRKVIYWFLAGMMVAVILSFIFRTYLKNILPLKL